MQEQVQVPLLANDLCCGIRKQQLNKHRWLGSSRKPCAMGANSQSPGLLLHSCRTRSRRPAHTTQTVGYRPVCEAKAVARAVRKHRCSLVGLSLAPSTLNALMSIRPPTKRSKVESWRGAGGMAWNEHEVKTWLTHANFEMSPAGTSRLSSPTRASSNSSANNCTFPSTLLAQYHHISPFQR